MTIASITIASVAPMSDHAANRGEKLLGNASSIKRRPDGRVYISGQMQRHALFSAINRLNEVDPARGDTHVSNGDAPTTEVGTDLRSDLGGFLDTQKESYSGRRTAPVTATPAVALAPSDVGQDLLVRLKMSGEEQQKKQALATNEYSQRDDMRMCFHIDVGAVGRTRMFRYTEEKHGATEIADHGIDAAERRRRIGLVVEATRSLTDYANQARQAASGEPERVLIALDPKMSRKVARYFEPFEPDVDRSDDPATRSEQRAQAAVRADTLRQRMVDEVEARGGLVFVGDDRNPDADSVDEAYRKALAALAEHDLYDPADHYDAFVPEEAS